jgi:hypothetical protein
MGGERRGRPVAAAVIVLVAMMCGLVGWVVAGLTINLCGDPATYDGGDMAVIVDLLVTGTVVLAGPWVAWRVGTGHWGRRRLPTAPSSEATAARGLARRAAPARATPSLAPEADHRLPGSFAGETARSFTGLVGSGRGLVAVGDLDAVHE